MTTGPSPATGADTFTQEIAVGLVPATRGLVRMTVSIDLHPDLRELTLTAPDHLAVQATTGFDRDGPEFAWDGATEAPRIAFHIEADRTNGSGHTFVDSGDWAILTYPRFGTSWRYVESEVDVRTTYRVDGPGVTSSDGSIAYLGPHDAVTSSAAGQTFRLVVPRAAQPAFEPERVLASLGHAARQLRVGGADDEVLVLAAPSGVNWGPDGLQRGACGFWAKDTCTVGTVQNTWLHEYVHTRQAWEPDASTKWLVEGTTEYYAALLTFQQGYVDFDELYRYLSTDRDRDAVLAIPEAWPTRHAHYTKGRRVVAALDARIRAETGGSKTFETVFRELNSVEGALTHGTLCECVTSAVGESCAAWLDEIARSRELPDVPRDEALFRATATPAEPTGAGDPEPEPTTTEPAETGDPEPESTPTEPAETGDPEPESTPTEPDGSDDTEPEPTPPDPGGSDDPEPPSTEPTDPAGADGDTCPVCGAAVDDSPYCGTCGTSLDQQCPVCGRDVHDERYCPECGTALR